MKASARKGTSGRGGRQRDVTSLDHSLPLTPSHSIRSTPRALASSLDCREAHDVSKIRREERGYREKEETHSSPRAVLVH